ncbi:Hint domain-containing protein [Pseudoponticoccus marisrubri]|uniref:2,3,4,5-tetrahydropyridine-2,6-carboxylate N-succinyltransferase n=1 Tax=Pseudoponticoccus marisrubri TaxID=1685382 RepID=A0A0W7WJ07_9RHOB|nr:Hint domain-containing protein [Pseudoponticoccus marisrubri]KUF10603.1 2,3,4,5-tetrahydropyridine-2,6-carboxylate N-succinyltransferase [Pseudoponticoccus marisrubri]
MVAPSELPINTNATATQMAQTIMGDGVTIVSASYTGDGRSSGIYSDGLDTSPGVAPSDTGVILSTGRAADFTNSASRWWWWNSDDSNQNTDTSTNTSGPNNQSDFNAAAGANTYDASYMDIDFIPTGDTMTMQFVFSSEEYPEYQTSLYQDFVGVWINGTQVDVEIGDGDVDPRNVNDSTNENLFVDNTDDQYNTEMDGFTVTMTLTIPVNPGQVNSIRIGVADVLDTQYDSNLLIAADSVQTTLVAQSDQVTVNPTGSSTLDALANDDNATGGTLSITHINGIAVSAGDTVTLNTGQQVTLNADGTMSVLGDGDEETINYTYTVASSTGQTDVGYVTVESVPCFVAGTLIDTVAGPRPVETLRPGDLVETRDRGPQPLRWIGQRTVAATGDFAPVQISAGAMGDHDALRVSPQHRILVQDVMAHLLFEDPEVLAAARHLVNGQSIRVVEGGQVTYVHLLFDRHEIIRANGLLSESFLPGPQTASVFARETLEEIVALFPELDPATGAGYGPAARRILRRHEAALLRGGRAA